METIGTWWMWSGFFVLVMAMLTIDLLLGNGDQQKRVSAKRAATWSVVWVAVSLLFAGGLWWYLDANVGREIADQKTTEFVTGYLIEKSLAIDNVFVWLMLFSFFSIPIVLQKRVLTYGVLGAIAMRTVMIFAGVWLIAKFHWVLYVFGAFLLITGLKMWFMADEKPNLANNAMINWLKRHIPMSEKLHDEKFFVTLEKGGKMVRQATPLFLVLILVEFSDVIFAVDSIPAIFAITTDPFIVLTSNIFAILGLRAMYFLLGGMADRLSLLKYGLAMVLVFIGSKMLIVDLFKIPTSLALATVATIITISIVLSLRKEAKERTSAGNKPLRNAGSSSSP